MKGFWTRFATLNASFLAANFRKWADQIDLLIPGPPAVAFPLLFVNHKEIHMGEITVDDSSAPLEATATYLDAKGAPTTADDVPVWSSDRPEVADVAASADGLSTTVTIGVPGAAVISSTTTNSDGTTVVSQGTVTVQPGNAVIGSIDFTAPTP